MVTSSLVLVRRFRVLITVLVILLWMTQVRIWWQHIAGSWHRWVNGDFDHYYLTAWRIVSSSEVYCALFSAQERALFGFGPSEVLQPTNPPLLALFLTPIAFLTPFGAWIVYTVLSLAVVVASCVVVMRAAGASSQRGRIGVLLLVLFSSPLLWLLHFSQVQGFILGCVVWALICADRKPITAGILLGLAIALKGYVLPLIPFAVVTGRYRLAGVTAIATGAFSLLPYLIDERLSLLEYLRCGVPHVEAFALAYSGNQGMAGVLKALGFLTLLPWTGLAVEDIAHGAYVVGMSVWLASGFVVGAILPRRFPSGPGLALMAAASVLVAPLSWPHYFLIVWPYLLWRWQRIQWYEKIIIWFSAPLSPVYVSSNSSSSVMEAITSFEGSLLTWLPALIFFVQFGVIAWRHVQEERAAAAEPSTRLT